MNNNQNNNIICPSCGTVNPENSNYCLACSQKLEKNYLLPTNENEKVVERTIEQKEENSNNTKICNNCHAKIEKSNNFCPNCGAEIDDNGTTPTILGVISSLSLLGAFVVPKCSAFLLLLGVTIMIFGRIKYPKNKLLKIVMYLMIVALILFSAFAIIFVISCASCLSHLP